LPTSERQAMKAMERLPRTSTDAAAAAIKAMVSVYRERGAPLYAALSERVPEEPELVAIAAHSLAGAPAVHLFGAVHYLLLSDPRDPLAQFFPTLAEWPAPPERAFPLFAQFCRNRRKDIVHLLKTRTVQTTYAERCQIMVPPLSHVANSLGEPLDIIEIGCSAGVLLTFDKYAYELRGRGFLGLKDAPLTFRLDVRGGPELHIPRLGKRIGLDLRPIDVTSQDERRWLLALSIPERLEGHARLATALDVVARTEINYCEGDALELLPELIAGSPGPLCICHSACVLYWSTEAKAALDVLLSEASRGREFYRVGMEFDLQRPQTSDKFVEVVITHYCNGAADSEVVAYSTADGATFTWLN